MITISAFADEIGPELGLQMDVCEANGIKCIDVRNIDDKNVSKMSLDEVRGYHRQMADRGFSVPCIGSPIGKIRIDEDFDAHLDLLKHCCDVAGEFGTRRIRVFSFYPSPGADIMRQRGEVMERIEAMVKVAESADAVLYHENESRIYGAKPEGVRDIFSTIRSDRLRGIFDPANFVIEDIAPYNDGWCQGLAELTGYFHVKDKSASDNSEVCVPAGEGGGQFREIFADLSIRDWSGYMTLEPHMAVAGQFRGFTGPDLFGEAASALKTLCDEAGIAYE